MTHSQFSLTWDSHKTNICGGFCALQQNGEFVDMTLAADGHFVKVHQVMIALSSPYLKELITSVPSTHPVIFLNNVSHSILTLLLEYIYTGEVMVPPASLTAFMDAGKSLQIKGLETIQNEKISKAQTSEPSYDTPGSAKRMKTEHFVQQVSRLPIINRNLSIKPESNLSPAPGKININNSMNRDDDNDYSMGFETHEDSVCEDAQEVNKPNDIEVKSSNLQFTVSIRGALQVILNRYIYNLQSTQNSGVKRWRCIDYRNIKCMASLVTKDNVVLNRSNPHNHSFHDKKILQKIEKNSVYSALYELEAQQEKERVKQDEEEEENIEFITSEIVGDLPDLADVSKNN
ncbi:unnamed protein product [Pieris macdunnoughi]|uniref:BTB domain-containing protein n=2 Tax=Pieris TaxID=7115 RepID=A0A821UNF2_9NEOP|nr:unnamed protein product [Pieris macdunnoughi]